MRHRVTIEAPGGAPDGAGGTTPAWNAVATVWAAIEALSGSESVTGDAVVAEAKVRITLRYRDDLTAAQRLRAGSRIFDIGSVRDPDGTARPACLSVHGAIIAMINAALAVQIALRDALLAHAGLTGVPVFDSVPQGTPAPYITIAGIESRDWSTKDSKGAEHIVTLHVWSRHQGKAAAYGLLAEIDAALDGADLTLTDHRLVNLSTVFWTVTAAGPDDLHRGLVRLRAATEPL